MQPEPLGAKIRGVTLALLFGAVIGVVLIAWAAWCGD